MKLYDLKLNFQESPLLNDNEQLFFSWKIDTLNYSLTQIAYKITLFNQNFQWSSGWVEDNRSLNIAYTGEPLQTESVYQWSLEVKLSNQDILNADGGKIFTSCNFEPADWITTEAVGTTPIFSKSFSIKNTKNIESILFYTSSLGIYELSVNDKIIGHDKYGNKEVLNPGWSDYNRLIQYQCFDLVDYVENDNVRLEAKIGKGWFAGKIGRNSFYENLFQDKQKQLCFIGKLVVKYTDGEQFTICTSTDWDCYSSNQLIDNDLYDGEVVDFTVDDKDYVGKATLPLFIDTQQAMKRKLKPTHKHKALKQFSIANKPISGYLANPSQVINISEKLPFGELEQIPIQTESPITWDIGDLFIDFGQNCAGVFQVELENLSDAVTTIEFQTAEMLNDGKENPRVPEGGSDGPRYSLYTKSLSLPAGGECLSRDRISIKGNQIVEYSPSFTYHGFRYLKISSDHPIKINKIEQVPVSSTLTRTGKIHTNNLAVNKLVENTIWSQRSNYLTIPTDCPQRSERVGWTGDVQIFLPTALHNFDVYAFLENYADIINHSSTESQYSSIIPQAFVPKFSSIYASGWSDLGIILPWELYKYSGNEDILEKYYDNMATYMVEIGSLTSTETKYNEDIFGDWLSFQPTSTPYMNLMYRAYTASLMAEIANILGKKSDSTKYENLFQLIKDYVQQNYISNENDEFNLLTATKDNLDVSRHGYKYADNAQTGLLWFLKLKLYKSEIQKEQALVRLITNIQNDSQSIRNGQTKNSLAVGFLGINVLLPVLSDFGESSVAYDLLLNEDIPSWLYSVNNGATTIWERWNSYSLDNSFADSSMNSFNHYSYGSVLEWLYQYAAGIKYSITSDGQGEVKLRPMIDKGEQYNNQERISTCEATFESFHGPIKTKWSSNNGVLKDYEVSIPINVKAQLILDLGDLKDLNIGHCEGILSYDISNKNQVSFGLLPGEYLFSNDQTKLTILRKDEAAFITSY